MHQNIFLYKKTTFKVETLILIHMPKLEQKHFESLQSYIIKIQAKVLYL